MWELIISCIFVFTVVPIFFLVASPNMGIDLEYTFFRNLQELLSCQHILASVYLNAVKWLLVLNHLITEMVLALSVLIVS